MPTKLIAIALAAGVSVAGSARTRPYPQAARHQVRSGPVALGIMVSGNSLVPLVSAVDGVVCNAHASLNDVREKRVALSRIPKTWLPLWTSFPTEWILSEAGGKRWTIKAVAALAEDGPNDGRAVVRTTAAPKNLETESFDDHGVAFAGDLVGPLNFIEQISDESPEGMRLLSTTRRLLHADILQATESLVSRTEGRAPFLVPVEQIDSAEAGTMAFLRPRHPLLNGTRPVLVDYLTLHGASKSPSSDCRASIHVSAWLNETRPGDFNVLSREIEVSASCDPMSIHVGPLAIATIGASEIWLGYDQYEDGQDPAAYAFGAGRLRPLEDGPGCPIRKPRQRSFLR